MIHGDLFDYGAEAERKRTEAAQLRERADRLEMLARRDEHMGAVERTAGEIFRDQAREFVQAYLAEHGPTPGETITDRCKGAGIRPHDDRAFGPVYMALARDRIIEKCGSVERRKGHGCAGGNVWRLCPVDLNRGDAEARRETV